MALHCEMNPGDDGDTEEDEDATDCGCALTILLLLLRIFLCELQLRSSLLLAKIFFITGQIACRHLPKRF